MNHTADGRIAVGAPGSEARLKEALAEILRNVELWAKVDNMAGRIAGICKEALQVPHAR